MLKVVEDAVASGKNDANCLCHAHRIAWFYKNMNPLFVTAHPPR